MKGGYDILPNIMLVGAEQELSQTGKEHRLKEAIAPVAPAGTSNPSGRFSSS